MSVQSTPAAEAATYQSVITDFVQKNVFLVFYSIVAGFMSSSFGVFCLFVGGMSMTLYLPLCLLFCH